MAAAPPSNELSLLPTARQGQAAVEGLKTHRLLVPKRTLDITGPIVKHLQQQLQQRNIIDALAIQSTLTGSLDVLPPAAYLGQPVSSCNTRFVHALVNKSRTTINAVVWLPGGRRVYTGAHTGEFTIWGGSSFAFESNLQAHESPVRAMRFSHNGLWLLSGDETGAVKCWKPQLELMAQTKEHSEAVSDISFAPSDLKYASASRDSSIKVWDFPTSAVEQSMTGHGGDINAAHWHPHHALVASGSKDSLVKMWDVKSGKHVATLHGHKSSVSTASWNNNGNWLLTGSKDQTCRVWDVRTLKEVGVFAGHGRDVLTAAWHPVHEDLFASGAANGSLLYWLVGRPSSQGEVRGAHEAGITALAWHPEGHVVCTGSSDHMLRFWARPRPGDGVDHFQAAMRRQEAGEGDAPMSKAAPTVASTTCGIPGITLAIPTRPTTSAASPVKAGVKREISGAPITSTRPTAASPGRPQGVHQPGQGPSLLSPTVPHTIPSAPNRSQFQGRGRGREWPSGGRGRGRWQAS